MIISNLILSFIISFLPTDYGSFSPEITVINHACRERTQLTSKAAHINHLAMKHQVSVCQTPANHFCKNPNEITSFNQRHGYEKEKGD